jgi:carbamoyl-phosphate synthase small subunit
MTRSKNIKLVLSDGTEYCGRSFGYGRSVSGEVVFNTAMVGYPENLTDPSYTGQILVSTYPLVGNYGVPDLTRENGMLKHFESDAIKVSGLIISDYSFEYSHWNAKNNLSHWLKANKIPAIYGIDTRALTKHIREKGAMPGKIIHDDQEVDFYDPNLDNLAAMVSTRKKITYGHGRYRIIMVDCGGKNNIVRCLLNRNATVIKVSWDHDFTGDEYDGVLLSNGPGDPQKCGQTINAIKKAFQNSKPILGICLGSQLMAIAAGAGTYKLKYGHRGHNQPVLQHGTDRCFITSQNHGFAVDLKTLGGEWEPLFTNVNDNTNEGIRHKRKPFFSAQFHPEASSGPVDTEFIFDEFMNAVKRWIKK